MSANESFGSEENENSDACKLSFTRTFSLSSSCPSGFYERIIFWPIIARIYFRIANNKLAWRRALTQMAGKFSTCNFTTDHAATNVVYLSHLLSQTEFNISPNNIHNIDRTRLLWQNEIRSAMGKRHKKIEDGTSPREFIPRGKDEL